MPDTNTPGAFLVLAATVIMWWFYGRNTLPDKPRVPMKDRKPIYYDPKKDGPIKLPE